MRKTASNAPEMHINENFARNENVISPKNSAIPRRKGECWLRGVNASVAHR